MGVSLARQGQEAMLDRDDRQDRSANAPGGVAEAMNRVLAAERAALADLETCRQEADGVLEAGRREARSILDRRGGCGDTVPMKIIRNTTLAPIRVPLGAGKVLHLGPGKTGEVADSSAERPAFVKLLDAGTIQLVGDGDGSARGGDREQDSIESTHGRKATRVQRTGDR